MHKAIRYIGSKQKVLPFLEENLFYQLKEGDSFFDGFVGSGIVSQYVAEKHNTVKVSGGDLSLYSEILFNILNIGQAFKTKEEIYALITEFEGQSLISSFIYNEFSHTGTLQSFSESRNFFHEKSGKTIDTYKQFVKENGEVITGSKKPISITEKFVVKNENGKYHLKYFTSAYLPPFGISLRFIS